MELECPKWIPSGVISDDQGRNRDDTQKDNGRNDAMGDDDGMVPSHILESVPHALKYVSLKTMFPAKRH